MKLHADAAGNLVNSDKEKVNLMNNFFLSVFTNEDPSKDLDERVYDQHLSEFDITPEMVKEKLNPSKSPGHLVPTECIQGLSMS